MCITVGITGTICCYVYICIVVILDFVACIVLCVVVTDCRFMLEVSGCDRRCTTWVSQSPNLLDMLVGYYCRLSMGIACCQVLVDAQAAGVDHARPSCRLHDCTVDVLLTIFVLDLTVGMGSHSSGYKP